MPLRSSGFSSAVLQAVGFGFHAIRPETRSHYARKGHTETSGSAPPPATQRRPTAKSHKGASGKRRSERPRRHAFGRASRRSEEHTSELQSLMRISYAVFCLKKKNH